MKNNNNKKIASDVWRTQFIIVGSFATNYKRWYFSSILPPFRCLQDLVFAIWTLPYIRICINFISGFSRELFVDYYSLSRQNSMTPWIIERLDRKLADAIVSNIVEKCDVTLSRAIQPHSTFCASYVSSHISLSLSSTIHIGHVLK